MAEGKCFPGFYASFEGNDGCGKSTLIRGVRVELERRGLYVVSLDEFSDAPSGELLLKLLTEDKFLRSKDAGAMSSRTLAAAVFHDLAYMTEQQIVPALEDGAVVLKDRGPDTVAACQIPIIQAEYGTRFEEEYAWLKPLLDSLPVQPDMTVYLEVPLATRIGRIVSRDRDRREARAHEVSAKDMKVFEARERAYDLLARAKPSRIMRYDNSVSLEKAVADISAAIAEARDEKFY